MILDVVYNHTAEGSQLGPTLCFRGIDNAAYYRLQPDSPRHYQDFTGCGNTLNMQHPRVLQLVMDSLRYWVTEMHVDGFRFDLASALARELHAVDRLSAFFDILRQDPVLSRVKLIAEPWDLGAGGYQVGNFPVGWAEWNDKYRDTMRAYWKGDGGLIGEFAQRLTGSSDLYDRSRPRALRQHQLRHRARRLHAADLVSYNDKHNEANGEDNRDGHGHNLSWNCGVEGPTDDAGGARAARAPAAQLPRHAAAVAGRADAARRRRDRPHPAAATTTPTARTTRSAGSTGSSSDAQRSLLDFTRMLIGLREAHPVFRRRDFFQGRPLRGSEVRDIVWLHPDGSRDDRRRMAARTCTRTGGVPVRRGAERRRCARPRAAGRQFRAAVQRGRESGHVRAARAPARVAAASCLSTPREHGRRCRRRFDASVPYTLRRARSSRWCASSRP